MTAPAVNALLRAAAAGTCAAAAVLAAAANRDDGAAGGWPALGFGAAAAAAAFGRGRASQVVLAATSAWLLVGACQRGPSAPVDWALRIAAPAVLAAGLTAAALPPAAAVVLRGACILTFAGHGLEAIGGSATFRAYLTAAGELAGVHIDAGSAAGILVAIGIVDLLAAAAALLRRDAVLLWMAGWGAATAAVRIVHGGAAAWPEALLRLPHAFGPLALWCHVRTRARSAAEG